MKTYIQLGRAGDILTLLPLLQNSPERCALMVSQDYASLLEGIPEVEPVIFKGPPWEIGNAVAQCEAEGRDWVCTQVNGPKEAVAEFVYKRAGQDTARTTSFQKEMYKVCGRLAEWDRNYPLVMPRDKAREEALLEEWKPQKGKFILAAMDGISSPFPYKALALELLKHIGWPVVDLGKVKAHKLTDLLGLYQEAQCLIAIDSAPLQLARAMPLLPVLALTRDTPLLWNGSSWRPNHWWYCRYSDFPARAVEMLQAVRDCFRFKYCVVECQRVIHFWNAYEGGQCERPANWWIPLPITVGACGRDSKLNLKDEKRLPYLKDSLRMALQKADDGDWVCLTRPEVRFKDGAPADLLQSEAAFAYRLESSIGQTFFPIGDMFYARKKVWQAMLPEIPDMILGGDVFWAHALVALFRGIGAQDVTGYCYKVLKNENGR